MRVGSFESEKQIPSRANCVRFGMITTMKLKWGRGRDRGRCVTIGILGGGQLGCMLALGGYPLGLHFRFLDPSPQAPVGRIAHRVTAEYSDHDALEKFAHGLELVTYEFENVPVEAARFLAKHVPVYPPPEALEAAQDRLNEKSLFKKLGIATTSFPAVNGAGDVDAAVKKIGLPAVVEKRGQGARGERALGVG